MTTAPYLDPVFDPTDPDGRNTDEAELKQAIEATARLVDMDTGEIHVGTALTPAALDGEWISREARLQTLEQEAYSCRDRLVRAHLDFGRCLLEHRELCQARKVAGDTASETRFDSLIERLGVSARSAYEHIAVAGAVSKLPALANLADGSFKKLLAIIEGTTEEQIAKIAAGQGDLTLDEIDQLSVRKLKARLRKAELEVGKIVAAETKKLRSDLEAVTEDLTLARSALDADVSATRKTVDAVRALITELSKLSDRFSDQVAQIAPQEGDRLLVRFESEFGAASTILESTWRRWQDRRIELGLTD